MMEAYYKMKDGRPTSDLVAEIRIENQADIFELTGGRLPIVMKDENDKMVVVNVKAVGHRPKQIKGGVQ